jgi:hypothetical protein
MSEIQGTGQNADVKRPADGLKYLYLPKERDDHIYNEFSRCSVLFMSDTHTYSSYSLAIQIEKQEIIVKY